MAKCKVCGAELTDENWRPSCKKNHDYRCIACIKQYQKQYRESHKEEKKQYQKQYDRLRKYGITEQKFNEMLKQQNNRCAICGQKFDKYNKPHIDHNHETGKEELYYVLNVMLQ